MNAKEINTVDYEIFYNKFFNSIDEAKEVVRYLSGSVITKEAGEVQVAFYDPDSHEASMISCGILMHIMNITRALNHMLENRYGEDIGIYDGDQFFNNDAFIGGMHVPDTGIIAPYFYKGNFMGYIAAISHTTEVGAIEPGGMCPSATEAWHDGVIFPCVKLVEKSVMRRDVLSILLRGVRDPNGMELDVRARIAGNEKAKQRLDELIDEFGVEFFRMATKRMLDDGEKSARTKIKGLTPGTYSSLVYTDAIGVRGDKLAVIYQEMEVTEEGEFIFRYPAVSPQLPSFNNCYIPAIEAGIFYILLEKIFYDIRWNTGSDRLIQIEAPHGSRVNADSAQSVGYCTVGIGDTLVHSVIESLSLAQYVAGQEIEVDGATGSINFIASGGV
ncbi:MAG: hydantoinase B/oxoprolinase family protein, partial [Thermodesulfobacteriota bacterium]|nr:hydantoinase B/oxoprolinase family protein [Thermodesulfobacteriota bacterium]